MTEPETGGNGEGEGVAVAGQGRSKFPGRCHGIPAPRIQPDITPGSWWVISNQVYLYINGRHS